MTLYLRAAFMYLFGCILFPYEWILQQRRAVSMAYRLSIGVVHTQVKQAFCKHVDVDIQEDDCTYTCRKCGKIERMDI
ncbi:hypothetical protein Q5Y75_05855 [Ruegeria sp. 2205SS24-7]|uniref:hypothetical protein n=1 Tax=Ruegeria discodermiae TaxID=3064389 RepID=UPI002740B983|nr:hypothetical protein [Ruegeria sp. 2205SS24-7]MDP5216736.1 hypothetical protein [Ruegeria sp. 2205SS24-7]